MTKPAWYPEEENNELILDFILWFSRIEYALKSSTSFSGKGRNGHFQANWRKFKKALKKRAIPSSLSAALEYIKSQPPKEQKSANEWEEISAEDDWGLLVKALKTVRNNLFHGGKYYGSKQPVRDTELLEHCLLIMQEVVELAPDEIKTVFNSSS